MDFIYNRKQPVEYWYDISLLTDAPWENMVHNSDNMNKKFSTTHRQLLKLVSNGDFTLTQFDQYKNIDIYKKLNQLMWRHYIVFWTSLYSAKSTQSNIKNYVEMGVADGLTIYFAINAVKEYKFDFKAYLYDTWDKVLLDNPSTLGKQFEYDYLDINVTKNNLNAFNDKLYFKRGMIPETFNGKDEPKSIVWMSLDLNSNKPTIESLDYYWDRLESGGVILVDDYAQQTYVDTKRSIDIWISKHNNSLLFQVPTSQAIIFKTNNK